MIDTTDVLDELRALLDEREEPAASAPELAERLPTTRRTILNKLDVLEGAGEIASKEVGRTRIFWPVPLADPSADPPEEPEAARFPPAEPPEEPPTVSSGGTGAVDELADAVDAVARDWLADDQERREAALAGLQWLREDGGPARAKDFRAALLDEHGVESQSPDTWWRRTVRPALQEAEERGLAEYQHGRHQYHWTG